MKIQRSELQAGDVYTYSNLLWQAYGYAASGFNALVVEYPTNAHTPVKLVWRLGDPLGVRRDQSEPAEHNTLNIAGPDNTAGDTPAVDHYQRLEPEPIDVIDSWNLDFLLGNAVKYISRAGFKAGTDGADDLRKAITYIERKIAQLEGRRAWK